MIVIIIRFYILSDSSMFRPGDDHHISAPSRILETQYFAQHMSNYKQCCHRPIPNDIRYL